MTLRLNVGFRPDAMKVSFPNTHVFIAVDSGRMLCTGKMLDGASKGFGGCRSNLSACAYRSAKANGKQQMALL